jgi:hypothetical protein
MTYRPRDGPVIWVITQARRWGESCADSSNLLPRVDTPENTDFAPPGKPVDRRERPGITSFFLSIEASQLHGFPVENVCR